MTIRIVTVYPDLLGTYGDSGNGIVLEQRMKRRGLNVEHLRVNSHHSLPKADLYVIGGGEDGRLNGSVMTLSSWRRCGRERPSSPCVPVFKS